MDEKYRRAVDAAAIFSETDLTGRITYVNDQFCALSGYSRDELLGQNHRVLNSGFHPAEFFLGMWRTIALGNVWKGEICNRAKDGSLFYANAEGRLMRDDPNQTTLDLKVVKGGPDDGAIELRKV